MQTKYLHIDLIPVYRPDLTLIHNAQVETSEGSFTYSAIYIIQYMHTNACTQIQATHTHTHMQVGTYGIVQL